MFEPTRTVMFSRLWVSGLLGPSRKFDARFTPSIETMEPAATALSGVSPAAFFTAPSNNAGTLVRMACSDFGELMLKVTVGEELLISPVQFWKLKPNLVCAVTCTCACASKYPSAAAGVVATVAPLDGATVAVR